MRAREIIYENRQQHLRAIMHKKKGDLRLAMVRKRRKYYSDATRTSEIVLRQLHDHFRAAMHKHKRSCGRARLTLRDINKIRKQNMRDVKDEKKRLFNVNRMYGRAMMISGV